MKKQIIQKIFLVLVGVVIGGIVVVKATTSIAASQIAYSHEKTTASTVNEALDELIAKLDTYGEQANRYYLYNEGNEYTDITGGWGEHIGVNGYQNASTGWLTKADNYMELNMKATGSYYKNFTTNNKVDLQDYTLVGVEYQYTPSSNGTNMASGAIIYTSALSGVTSTSGWSYLPYHWISTSFSLLSTDNRVVQYYMIDKSVTKNGYFGITHGDYYSGSTVKVYKIWLE